MDFILFILISDPIIFYNKGQNSDSLDSVITFVEFNFRCVRLINVARGLITKFSPVISDAWLHPPLQ